MNQTVVMTQAGRERCALARIRSIRINLDPHQYSLPEQGM
jgi:hypothetical protein